MYIKYNIFDIYNYIYYAYIAVSEAFQDVGQIPPSKYAPDEIRISIFLPLMKKAFMGGIGGKHQN